VGGLGAGGGGGGSVRGGGGGELLEDLFGFLLDYLSGLGADAAAEHRDERQGGGDRENERVKEGGRERAGTAPAGEELHSHGVSGAGSQCLGAALSAVNNLVAALLLTPSGSLSAAPGPLERAGEQVFLRVCMVYSALALRLCQSQPGGVGSVGSEDLLLLALEERCRGDAGAVAQYCRGVAELGLLLAVLQTKFNLLHFKTSSTIRDASTLICAMVCNSDEVVCADFVCFFSLCRPWSKALMMALGVLCL